MFKVWDKVRVKSLKEIKALIDKDTWEVWRMYFSIGGMGGFCWRDYAVRRHYDWVYKLDGIDNRWFSKEMLEYSKLIKSNFTFN